MARRVTGTFDFARNAAASFSGPSNIAILPAGNLYVTDQGDEAVTERKITPAGQIMTLVDPRTNQALQMDGSTVIAQGQRLEREYLHDACKHGGAD